MVNPALHLFYTSIICKRFQPIFQKFPIFDPRGIRQILWGIACWNKTLHIEISNIPFTWQYKINLQTI